MTADDTEDWVYHQLDDTTHLLHGVVHANGYGHLLRVNGREGGSRILSGCHIMDFWDRLCKNLGVRLGFLIVFASVLSSCLLMKVIHSYVFKCGQLLGPFFLHKVFLFRTSPPPHSFILVLIFQLKAQPLMYL